MIGKVEVAAGVSEASSAADRRQIEEDGDRHRPDPDQRGHPALVPAGHRLSAAPGCGRDRSAAARPARDAPTTSISSTASAAPERPVLRIGEGDLDVVGDGNHRLAAEHLGLGDGADREHEGQQAADDDAGHGQRQLDLAKHLQPARAEIVGGFDGFARHHRHAERHREQHEGQIDIDHAEDDHAGREQHAFGVRCRRATSACRAARRS